MFLSFLLSLLTACTVTQAAGENDFQPATAMSVTAPYWGHENYDSSTLPDREAELAEVPPRVLVPGHFVQTFFADGDREHCQGQKNSILIIFRRKSNEAN